MAIQTFIHKHLYHKTIISVLLFPLSLPYTLIAWLKRKFQASSGWVADIPIISVGNIVSGGTGKTPFTVFLAKYLQGQGKKVAVSHRGYKGEFENILTIISTPDKILPEAEKAGDEAQLLAHLLPGIPVIAGRNRKNAIRMLLRKYPELDFIILDDSFQHFAVKHTLDFVLFKTEDSIGNGFVLPAGILRENISAIKSADCLVFTGKGRVPDFALKSGKPHLKGNYQVVKFYSQEKKEISMQELKDSKIALISALGNPVSFERTIMDLRLSYSKHFIFPDHHAFSSPAEIEKVRSEVFLNGIKYLITTEKDFTKLQNYPELPLAVMAIEFVPEDVSVLQKLLTETIN
ncbi:MAG: tetraacyldisaccharide 4'-kinase [Candidatus Cloacimonetes bacterium]|nr:tetraacyldisaccharide 4'-kinase [Candidatus Cloacimonadota bacterium]